jgi:hypothetical protein
MMVNETEPDICLQFGGQFRYDMLSKQPATKTSSVTPRNEVKVNSSTMSPFVSPVSSSLYRLEATVAEEHNTEFKTPV